MRALMVGMLVAAAVMRSAEADLDVTVTVDLGQDLGQNFGTLFGGTEAEGRLACGAGFAAVYNSYFRSERLKVQFFVRPVKQTAAYTLDPLPRAGSDSGAYPHGLGNDVYVHTFKPERSYQVWQEKAAQWRSLPNQKWPGKSAATVRGKRLEVRGDHLVYDGERVLDQAKAGGYRYSYYGQGHLFFYRKQTTDAGGEIKQITAVPWSPYGTDPSVDLAQGVATDLKMMKEFPYAWGQFGDEVLNCSNWGGLYSFDGKRWRVLVEADEKTSYQIYSMVSFGDRLLMAQYPSGVLFSYDGAEVKTLTGWPPVPPGASASVREAQTTAIYRGELLVGVWPWAELWRRDPDTQDWVFMRRMFTHPKLHAIPVHPYEPEAEAAGLVRNDLGQRLTAMVPTGDALLLGTSSKGGATVLEGSRLKLLTSSQRQEYGAMYRLKMPGNLAATITWRDGPTTLRFRAQNGRMSIQQDGRELASTSLAPGLVPDLSAARIQWGKGVFGPCPGEMSAMERR